ncbi:helix-turn-helix transcriptional regulator [Dictyobacter vulcani]|uniref:Helix-turn-helix transcriptional regulator n=1 Tax=Dictyobacter vulcani TaxID=2607529 RepID=A0A5J4KNU8_9CHLR|nr:helix-turn-helix transcriptional regulator [Dictyobacter vulcani]
MTRTTPEIQQGLLITHDSLQAIKVDTPAWFTWLTEHSVFRFTSSSGKFTARKEQRFAGWYWYAYRRQQGLLRTAYLGKSEEISLARLTEIAGLLHTIHPQNPPITGTPAQQFLLTTKITPPTLSSALIARPRLIDSLRKHAASKLFLITGPAGSGKTTLVSAWLQDLSIPIAWVSLDKDENELTHFWHYVLAAMQKIYPVLAGQLLCLLPTLQSGNMESFLIPLVNALGTLPEDVMLVLDDYHTLTNQQVHESVSFLLEHASDRLHIVIVSRSLPPVPLARLRARRQLMELGFNELRFSGEEAESFIQSLTERRITSEELAQLLEQTEGWVTGLYLTILAWNRGGSINATYPSVVDGDQQAIFEYLASEVLARESAQVRDFLLHTSILKHLQAVLCNAVTLQTGSQDILHHLERANLFLTRLDNPQNWFRYHHLFAEFLRTQLEQVYPEQAKILHSRAAMWYAQNNQPAEAIAHAVQAGDFVQAANFIEEQGRSLLMQQEILILSDWLCALPSEIVCSRPRLCIFMSWVSLHTAYPASIEHYLCSAEHSLQGNDIDLGEARELHGEIAAIRARISIYQSEIQQSVEYSQQALDCLGERDHYMRGEVALSMGTTSMLLGEMWVAQESFRVAINLSWDCGNLRAALLAVRSLANLYVSQGRLYYAHRLYQESLERIRQIGQEHIPPLGFVHVGLAEIYYEWDELDAAERHARQGIALGQ